MLVECNIKVRLSGSKSVFELYTCFKTSSSSIVFFGPSGSGKSLTLMILAGLIVPDSGRVKFEEQILFDSDKKINIPARSRKVGLLFQDYALFPHLNVKDNVGFGLKKLFRPLSRKQKNTVSELLDMFGLENQAVKMPHELSGGQRQRVALARALVSNPDLLLLDEPFSSLDQPLRVRMREELEKILKEFSMPMIMVSHDLEDVETFANTLVSFGHGRVLEVLDFRAEQKSGRSSVEIVRNLYDVANVNGLTEVK
jgi:molybdate transport system ATP-binding protein